MVALGLVRRPEIPPGGLVRSVSLAVLRSGALEGAQVVSDNPNVTGRVVPSASENKATLEVSLLPAVPAGQLQARLTLRLAGGHDLSLPVSALVVAPSAPAASSLPAPGKAAPPFTLVDADGKRRSLPSDLKDRPAALFFFCGCPWCAEVAREWGTLQRGNALTAPAGSAGAPPTPAPVTIVVYSGTAAEAKALLKETGLDAGQTWLLPDPELRVTQNLYHSEPCPRVFILDRGGSVRYVNAGPDDKPREAPAAVIAAKALTALRTTGTPIRASQSK
jgi:peroxiredoxin